MGGYTRRTLKPRYHTIDLPMGGYTRDRDRPIWGSSRPIHPFAPRRRALMAIEKS
ncbi:UNVERIFIED_CONTAM: hypothetical protein Sradi_6573600 [Sesamum radiatum]|uniref:Uncharacterized protein n=1 Tax=Sesamum radiatum TaxID=300843 RepID=A0AAW2JZH7_SESRA